MTDFMSAQPKLVGRILPDKSEVSRRGLESALRAAALISAPLHEVANPSALPAGAVVDARCRTAVETCASGAVALSPWEKLKAWRDKNPEKVHAQRARDWAKHKAKRREATRIWRLLNRDKIIKQQRAYKSKRRDHIRELDRRFYATHRKDRIAHVVNWQKRQCATLGNYYVRHKLSRGFLPLSFWPDSMVQAKRAQIQLQRFLWQLQKTLQNSGTNS